MMDIVVSPEELKKHTSKNWEDLSPAARNYIQMLEDNIINDTAERFDIMKGYNAEQLKVLPRDSYTNRNGVYIVGLKEYIERLRDEKSRYEKKNKNSDGTSVSPINDSAESKGEGASAGRYEKSQLQGESETNTNAPADSIGNADSLDKERSQYNNDKSRRLDQLLAVAESEDKKRITAVQSSLMMNTILQEVRQKAKVAIGADMQEDLYSRLNLLPSLSSTVEMFQPPRTELHKIATSAQNNPRTT